MGIDDPGAKSGAHPVGPMDRQTKVLACLSEAVAAQKDWVVSLVAISAQPSRSVRGGL